MTAAQRAAKDNIEDAQGAPASLTPYVFFFFFLFFFSVSLLFVLFMFVYIRQSTVV
jgi:hypothetical protein